MEEQTKAEGRVSRRDLIRGGSEVVGAAAAISGGALFAQPTTGPGSQRTTSFGAGIVEATGRAVERIRPGDRVLVTNTPNCGACYNCIRGRGDMCQMNPAEGEPLLPIGELADGTPVHQHNNTGGFASADARRFRRIVRAAHSAVFRRKVNKHRQRHRRPPKRR